MAQKGNKRESSLSRSVSKILELPPEVLMDLPTVTVIGNIQVRVENHRGIIEYAIDRIRIAVNAGELILTGDQLVLREILPDQILVDGHLQAITFDR